jgi:hypothetical protein
MPSRRQLTILGTILTAGLVAAPLHVTVKGWTPKFSEHAASAKDGKGGGNGNGGGKGNGGGAGGGNGGGKGTGGGKGVGVGKSTGGKSKSSSQASTAASGTAGQHYNPKTGDTIQINGSTIEVLHSNGMREKVSGGSYEMKDSRGRTIIERPATEADESRLRDMLG